MDGSMAKWRKEDGEQQQEEVEGGHLNGCDAYKCMRCVC